MNFENRYTISKKDMEEYLKTCVYAGYRGVGAILLILGVIITVAPITGLLKSVMPKSAGNTGHVFLIMGIILMVIGLIALLYHKLSATMIMGQFEKNHGSEGVETVLQFKEKIYQQEGKANMDYKYDRIKSIVDHGDYIYLVISKFLGLIIIKSKFTEGDADAFKEFIEKKCPHAARR